MGGITVSVHPLFFALGFYYALTGKIFVFIIYSLCALSHELGHSIVAQRQGYRLGKIILMPFGAVVTGNVDGLKFTDQIKIALAGPILNLSVCVFFIAIWWVFPEAYTFTELVVQANLSMALVNLIPAYPLDGGRVLSATLTEFIGEKKAIIVCKVLAGILGGTLFGCFIYSIFNQVNFSLMFFALFVIAGAFDKKRGNVYVKLYSGISEERLLCGMPVKKVALSVNADVKKLISILDVNAINEVSLIKNGKSVKVLGDDDLKKIIENTSVYTKLSEIS